MGETFAPQTTAQVETALRDAEGAGLRIWPRGAGHHTRSQPSAEDAVAVLDMTQMCTIRSIDDVSGIAHVDAGASMLALAEVAEENGWTTRHFGPVEESATVGGMLSRHWPGAPVMGYPDIRGACMGLTAYSSATQKYHYLPAPRKASGPDLRGFFIGGEGRAGVITEVWLGLAQAPERVETPGGVFLDAASGLSHLKACVRLGVRPWRVCLEMGAGSPIRVGWQLGGHSALVALWLDSIHASMAALAATPDSSTDPPVPANPALEDDADAPLRGGGVLLCAQGDYNTLSEALDYVWNHGLSARVCRASPYGARILVMGEGDCPEALSSLPWSALTVAGSPQNWAVSPRVKAIVDAVGTHFYSQEASS